MQLTCKIISKEKQDIVNLLSDEKKKKKTGFKVMRRHLRKIKTVIRKESGSISKKIFVAAVNREKRCRILKILVKDKSQPNYHQC